MSTVAVARCASYERQAVRAAVRECLDALDGLEALLRSKAVLLKPNLLSSTAGPDEPVNTHPEVVRAVAERLVGDFGCRVRIGDSCGTVRPHATECALANSGVFAVAEELGAEVVNFDEDGFETLDVAGPGPLRRFDVARAVLEAEVVVSLPKFKTHQLTLLTGAVKNMLGVVPGRGKKQVHLAAPKPDAMAEALVAIYAKVPPHLVLMDAVVGMEGNGPNGGTPRPVGLLLASRDGVAVDAVAGAIMGYAEQEVQTTRLAHERGLGVGRLDGITVLGGRPEEFVVPDFRKPFSYRRSFLFALIPAALARWFLRHAASYHSEVDPDRCVRCLQCVENCPSGALSEISGRIVCDRARCIACYCCEEVCDYDAVRVVRSPLVRAGERAKDLLRFGHRGRRRVAEPPSRRGGRTGAPRAAEEAHPRS